MALSTFDSLALLPGAAGDAERDWQQNPPLPGETPEDTSARQDSVAREGQRIFQASQRMKAGDYARRNMPAFTDFATGEVKPVTDATGAPLNNFDKRNAIAYDSAGNPQKIGYDANGPVLSDPFAGLPTTTDRRTGYQYKIASGLPWKPVGQDEEIKAQNLARDQDKAVAQASSAMGRQLTMDERNAHRQEVEFRHRDKEFAGNFGPIDYENPDDARAALETSFDERMKAPEANAKKGWFDRALSPDAEKVRAGIATDKAKALQHFDTLVNARQQIAQRRSIIDQTTAQRDQLEQGRIDSALGKARKAGVIPGLDEEPAAQNPSTLELAQRDSNPTSLTPAQGPQVAVEQGASSASPDSTVIPGLSEVQKKSEPVDPAIQAAVAAARSGKKPYAIDDAGSLKIDEKAPFTSLQQAVADKLIEAPPKEVMDAAQEKQKLIDSAGDHPEIKAALAGAGRGAAFLATAPIGAGIGAALTPEAFGLGGLIGGLVTGSAGAYGYGKLIEKLAEHNDTINSFVSAQKLHPYYSAAGEIGTFGAGLPRAAMTAIGEGIGRGAEALAAKSAVSGSTVDAIRATQAQIKAAQAAGAATAGTARDSYSVAANLLDSVAKSFAESGGGALKTIEGLTDMAKVAHAGAAQKIINTGSGLNPTLAAARAVGARIAIGAGGMAAIDTAIKEGENAAGLSDEHQTLGGLGIAAVLGVLASGHGIKRVDYSDSQLADIMIQGWTNDFGFSPEMAKMMGVPEGAQIKAKPLTPEQHEVYSALNQAALKGVQDGTLTADPQTWQLKAAQILVAGRKAGVLSAEVQPRATKPTTRLQNGQEPPPEEPGAPTAPKPSPSASNATRPSLYRGTSLGQWQAIQRGEQPQSEYTTHGNTWATTSRESADAYSRQHGDGAVIIEYKDSAHDKVGQLTADPGDQRRQGPLNLQDVRRVFDANGKVIYDSEAAASKPPTGPAAPNVEPAVVPEAVSKEPGAPQPEQPQVAVGPETPESVLPDHQKAKASPTATEPPSASQGQPTMITRQMEADLKARGVSEEQIARMTPVEAVETLAKPAPTAKRPVVIPGLEEEPPLGQESSVPDTANQESPLAPSSPEQSAPVSERTPVAETGASPAEVVPSKSQSVASPVATPEPTAKQEAPALTKLRALLVEHQSELQAAESWLKWEGEGMDREERMTAEGDISKAAKNVAATQRDIAKLEKESAPIAKEETIPGLKNHPVEKDPRIDKILAAARTPTPDVVESFQLLGTDGKWRHAGGFPQGVQMAKPVERRSAGWVVRAKDGTTHGKAEPTREALLARLKKNADAQEASFRAELEKMTPEQVQAQADYWIKETKPETAKPSTPDASDDIKRLKAIRYKTASQEKQIEILEAREKSDPSKWKVGHGIGYKVASGGKTAQTNRGFRIVEINAKAKMAKVRQVADTGLTSSGGDNDKIGEQWLHIADLVRDRKYDKPAERQTAVPGITVPAEPASAITQGQSVRLGKNPTVWTVEEQLPKAKGDQPDETFYRVTNERGDEQTVEAKDMQVVQRRHPKEIAAEKATREANEKKLDQKLANAGYDISKLPDAKSKRDAWKRHQALAKNPKRVQTSDPYDNRSTGSESATQPSASIQPTGDGGHEGQGASVSSRIGSERGGPPGQPGGEDVPGGERLPAKWDHPKPATAAELAEVRGVISRFHETPRGPWREKHADEAHGIAWMDAATGEVVYDAEDLAEHRRILGEVGPRWMDGVLAEEDDHQKDYLVTTANGGKYGVLQQAVWKQAPEAVKKALVKTYRHDPIQGVGGEIGNGAELIRMLRQLSTGREISETIIPLWAEAAQEMTKALKGWDLSPQITRHLAAMERVKYGNEESVRHQEKDKGIRESLVDDRADASKLSSQEAAPFSEANRLVKMDRGGATLKAILRENPAFDPAAKTLTVYRSAVGRDLRRNDYVALNRKVAEQHLENLRDRGEEGILSTHQVPADSLLMANDATEFVYSPEPKLRESLRGPVFEPKLRAAYDALVQRSRWKFPAVSIGELAKESGMPLADLKAKLYALHKQGRVVLSIGDWSLSTPETRAGMIDVNGQRMTQVRPIDDVLTSKTPAVEGAPKPEPSQAHHDAIVETVDKLKEQFPGVEVTVLHNEAEAPELEGRIKKRATHEGLTDTTNGKVYLFSDHLASPERAMEVFAHEVVGHFGVEKLIGEQEFQQIADMVLKEAPGAAKEIARLYAKGKALEDLTPEEKATIAREYVARMAEQPAINPSLWQRFLAFLRRALRKLGLRREWSNAELRDLVRRAARVVEKVKPEAKAETGEQAPDLHASLTSDSEERVSKLPEGRKDTRKDEKAAVAAQKQGVTKSRVADAIDATKNAAKAVGDYFTKLDPVDSYRKAKGEWLGAGKDQTTGANGRQVTAIEARNLQQRIFKQFPNKLTRQAVSRYIEADGDAAVLAQQAKASKPALRAVYERAASLNPQEVALAKEAQQFFDDLGAHAQKLGLLNDMLENYVTHFVDRSSIPAKQQATTVAGVMSNASGGKLKTRFDQALQRVMASMFELEQKGYRLSSSDIGEVMAAYSQSFNNTVSDRTFVKNLTTLKAEDGRPLAVTSGYAKEAQEGQPDSPLLVKPHTKPEDAKDYVPINHPALRKWKWTAQTPEGKDVMVEGDILVHPQIAQDLKNTLGTSSLNKVPLVRGITALQSEAKHLMLGLSMFHYVQEGTHAIGHRVNPFKLHPIDTENPITRELMNAGLLLGMWDAKRVFGEGLASSSTLLGKVPWLGKFNDQVTNFLFEHYIPGLKNKMAEDAFARNLKAYANDLASGKITREQVAQRTAQQANDAFGGQNNAYAGNNPTRLHAERLGFLAPDFLKSRLKFFASAFTKYGTEQRHALILLALTMMITAKVLERLITGQNDWEKPFAVVTPNREYELRSVPGDVLEMLQDPRRFINGRLSPLISRTTLEGITGRDWRGRKRSFGEQLMDAVKTPIPISIRGFVDKDAPELSAGEQVGNATGFRAKRHSEITRARILGHEWQKKMGLENTDEVYPQSKYLTLRNALEDHDEPRARKAYQELLKTGDREKVGKGFEESLMKPFSGSEKNEAKFVGSLKGEDLREYRAGVASRDRARKDFDRITGFHSKSVTVNRPFSQTTVTKRTPTTQFTGFN